MTLQKPLKNNTPLTKPYKNTPFENSPLKIPLKKHPYKNNLKTKTTLKNIFKSKHLESPTTVPQRHNNKKPYKTNTTPLQHLPIFFYSRRQITAWYWVVQNNKKPDKKKSTPFSRLLFHRTIINKNRIKKIDPPLKFVPKVIKVHSSKTHLKNSPFDKITFKKAFKNTITLNQP